MDYELHVHLNELIADLVSIEGYSNVDMVVTQTSKYKDTEYDELVIGLGCSKGLPTDRYYFNVLNGSSSIEFEEEWYEEPVTYYERMGKRCMLYRIVVSTMTRHAVVYEIGYGYKDEPIYHKVRELNLGNSKFKKKVRNSCDLVN